MRVGILAGCLGRGDGGPETYERELIRAIARQDKVNEYRIYAFEPTAASCLGALPDNFRVRVLWPQNRWISLTASLPVMMVRDSIDVLHGSLYPPPICPAPARLHDARRFPAYAARFLRAGGLSPAESVSAQGIEPRPRGALRLQ